MRSTLIDKLRVSWNRMEESKLSVVSVPAERRFSFQDEHGVEVLSVSVSDIREAPDYVREKFFAHKADAFKMMLAFGQWLSETDIKIEEAK